MFTRVTKLQKTVSMELDGHVLATENSTAMLHVESDESNLRLYVPKDKKERGVSYITQIPTRLAAHLSITNADGIKVISDILKVDTDILDEVLLDLGVPQVPDLSVFVDGDSHEHLHNDHEFVDDFVVESVSSSATTTAATPAPTVIRNTTPGAHNASFSARELSFNPDSRLVESEEIMIPIENYIPRYKSLLDHVISAGEEGNLPSASSMPTLSTPLVIDPDSVFGIRSRDIEAHDMRIGAAGELYVRSNLLLRLTVHGHDKLTVHFRPLKFCEFISILSKFETGKATSVITYLCTQVTAISGNGLVERSPILCTRIMIQSLQS